MLIYFEVIVCLSIAFMIYLSASVHSLATPIGSLMSGPLLDGIGRRGALQFSAIPLSVGWFIIGFATNIPCLLVGRVVLGFGVGLMAAPAQVRNLNILFFPSFTYIHINKNHHIFIFLHLINIIF